MDWDPDEYDGFWGDDGSGNENADKELDEEFLDQLWEDLGWDSGFNKAMDSCADCGENKMQVLHRHDEYGVTICRLCIQKQGFGMMVGALTNSDAYAQRLANKNGKALGDKKLLTLADLSIFVVGDDDEIIDELLEEELLQYSSIKSNTNDDPKLKLKLKSIDNSEPKSIDDLKPKLKSINDSKPKLKLIDDTKLKSKSIDDLKLKLVGELKLKLIDDPKLKLKLKLQSKSKSIDELKSKSKSIDEPKLKPIDTSKSKLKSIDELKLRSKPMNKSLEEDAYICAINGVGDGRNKEFIQFLDGGMGKNKNKNKNEIIKSAISQNKNNKNISLKAGLNWWVVCMLVLGMLGFLLLSFGNGSEVGYSRDGVEIELVWNASDVNSDQLSLGTNDTIIISNFTIIRNLSAVYYYSCAVAANTKAYAWFPTIGEMMNDNIVLFNGPTGGGYGCGGTRDASGDQVACMASQKNMDGTLYDYYHNSGKYNYHMTDFLLFVDSHSDGLNKSVYIGWDPGEYDGYWGEVRNLE